MVSQAEHPVVALAGQFARTLPQPLRAPAKPIHFVWSLGGRRHLDAEAARKVVATLAPV